MNFQSFNFHPDVMAGVRDLGYEQPTPIQEQAIPHIMEGRDVIGLAQTGTGKTAAFVLPVLHRLASGTRGSIRALIISPTRELAEQTDDVIKGLGRHTGLRSLSVYGGSSMEQQNAYLNYGVDIITACPGRLLDHLWKGTVRLSGLEVLVIDEADRMLDMGFLPDIRSILSCIMQERQTLLFSATMPPAIRTLAEEFLSNPVTVQVGRTLPAATVSHALYPVTQQRKTALLKEYLRTTDTDSVLIFTRTKHGTEQLARDLSRAGYRVDSLQGDMPQYRRQEALDRFRDGYVKILVATDIAARGIDILSISHVINYDMPESTDDYIHRIGRTGRVNNSGDAITLVTSADASKIRALENVFKAPLERRTLPGFDSESTEKGPRKQSGRPAADKQPATGPSQRRRSGNRRRRPSSRRPAGASPQA